MRFPFLAAIVVALTLTACGGKPTANMTPNESSYGQTITPDHHVPEEHQDKQK